MKKISYIIILLLILGLIYFLVNKDSKVATNFQECVAFGNPVMESYPRQCRDGDNLFVEEIGDFQYKDLLKVTSPKSGDLVSSPLVIKGEARGYWFFEASFPVRLLDEDRNEIAIGVAQAEAPWMTEDYVPFSVTINFQSGVGDIGYIIFEKDNPSGLPENADSVLMPVFFEK